MSLLFLLDLLILSLSFPFLHLPSSSSFLCSLFPSIFAFPSLSPLHPKSCMAVRIYVFLRFFLGPFVCPVKLAVVFQCSYSPSFLLSFSFIFSPSLTSSLSSFYVLIPLPSLIPPPLLSHTQYISSYAPSDPLTSFSSPCKLFPNPKLYSGRLCLPLPLSLPLYDVLYWVGDVSEVHKRLIPSHPPTPSYSMLCYVMLMPACDGQCL